MTATKEIKEEIESVFYALKSHTPKRREISTLRDWIDLAEPGVPFELSEMELPYIENLKNEADKLVKDRNPKLYVLREGQKSLCIKVQVMPVPPPTPHWMLSKNQKKKGLGNRKEKAKVGWVEELGWCRYDPEKDDYFYDPALNKKNESV